MKISIEIDHIIDLLYIIRDKIYISLLKRYQSLISINIFELKYIIDIRLDK